MSPEKSDKMARKLKTEFIDAKKFAIFSYRSDVCCGRLRVSVTNLARDVCQAVRGSKECYLITSNQFHNNISFPLHTNSTIGQLSNKARQYPTCMSNLM